MFKFQHKYKILIIKTEILRMNTELLRIFQIFIYLGFISIVKSSTLIDELALIRLPIIRLEMKSCRCARRLSLSNSSCSNTDQRLSFPSIRNRGNGHCRICGSRFFYTFYIHRYQNNFHPAYHRMVLLYNSDID